MLEGANVRDTVSQREAWAVVAAPCLSVHSACSSVTWGLPGRTLRISGGRVGQGCTGWQHREGPQAGRLVQKWPAGQVGQGHAGRETRTHQQHPVGCAADDT